MQEIKEKVCRICNIKKLVTEFHKAHVNTGGYKNVCKKCIKIQAAKYYIDNKSRIDTHQKVYISKNREKILNYQKKYHVKNREIDNLKHREWHMKNKKVNPSYDINKTLKQKYGITLEQKNKMIIDQNGLCGCCGKPLGIISRNICVDHDHSFKYIRKILCNSCNCALGFVKEDINIALKLVEYIKYCDSLKGNGNG